LVKIESDEQGNEIICQVFAKGFERLAHVTREVSHPSCHPHLALRPLLCTLERELSLH